MQVDLLVNTSINDALHQRSGIPVNAVVSALNALPAAPNGEPDQHLFDALIPSPDYGTS